MYKCCMHKNYSKFSARKHNINAFSGSNDARFELMMCPAFEKSLSESVLVVGMHSTLLAIAAIAGKRLWFHFHHPNAFSSIYGDGSSI